MLKITFILLILLFLLLFINQNNNGYYENPNILTNEAIARFEKDLKEGKEIIPSNYITPEKDYNNRASKLGLKCSMLIEKVVNKVLRRLIDYIS